MSVCRPDADSYDRADSYDIGHKKIGIVRFRFFYDSSGLTGDELA